MIKVLIVDDQNLIREGLSMMLRLYNKIDIVGQASNGEEAIEILDNEDEYIFEGLKNGADGYLLKDMSSEELVKSIERVHEGNVLLQLDVAKRLVGAIHGQTG